MSFAPFPPEAAWRHRDSREGFEVAFFRPHEAGGFRVEGGTSAVEEGRLWAVSYALELDARGVTRRVYATGRSAEGLHERRLEHDGAGHWRVDGLPAPQLEGCLDVDLQSSAVTNALPVRRLGLRVGEAAETPAAYVRAVGLSVGRLPQGYARLPDADGHLRFDYTSPSTGFRCVLAFDASGLVLDYPELAVRVR